MNNACMPRFKDMSPTDAKALHGQQAFEFRMGCPACYMTGIHYGDWLPPPRPDDPAYAISAFDSRNDLEEARARVEALP